MITSRQSPLSPHPLMSSSLPSHRTIHHHHHHHPRTMSMRRRHPTTANDRSNNCRHLNLSASIPLPPSHIHRTPSELQLADDILRAEYEDVRMCVRLVSGMRSQCLASGYVHPRTMQSVHDILKTKRANENQLGVVENNNNHRHPQLPGHAEEDEVEEEEDQDWGLAYEDVDEEDDSASGTPTPCHPYAMMSPFLIKSPSSSDGSALSLQQLHQSSNDRGSREDLSPPEEDECVFSLEL
ncbi:hypothetical protein ACHAWU_006020 [Discostella pseudostelligera]|uniref:Uncharacterized protein n=1 Tax=Discostella pseudostelligera TaxID=259834 RepID=A0ABD3MAL0_9STRA